jgi:hypothetical protein
MLRRLLNLLTLLSLLLPGCAKSGAGQAAIHPASNRAEPDRAQLSGAGTASAFDVRRALGGVGWGHRSRQIILTPASPFAADIGVRLLGIEVDGTVFISVDSSGETMAAVPGKPFLGSRRGPHNVSVFGNRGLVLYRSDPTTGAAEFTHRWAEVGPSPLFPLTRHLLNLVMVLSLLSCAAVVVLYEAGVTASAVRGRRSPGRPPPVAVSDSRGLRHSC